MVRPDRPDWFGWTISIVLHAEVIVIVIVFFGDTGIDDYRYLQDPAFHWVIQKPSPRILNEEPPDRYGRWPTTCDHRPRVVDLEQDRLGDGLKCERCGWPWWVIRAAVRE